MEDETVFECSIETWVYFRCKGCGKLAAPEQIQANDEFEPTESCPCFMGPRWERGIWISSPISDEGIG